MTNEVEEILVDLAKIASRDGTSVWVGRGTKYGVADGEETYNYWHIQVDLQNGGRVSAQHADLGKAAKQAKAQAKALMPSETKKIEKAKGKKA